MLKGGIPAVLVYLVGTLLGLSAGNAAAVAVYFSVGLLVCVGYVAAHLAGRTGAAALVDASIAGLFGVAVVVLKALLHEGVAAARRGHVTSATRISKAKR